MKNNRILVPVDFTAATDHAVRFAAITAAKSALGITLLHVEHKKPSAETESILRDLAGNISSEHGIACDFTVRVGNIFKEIPKEACHECYRFMVIGSHGFKGIREKFLGPDILKLVKDIPVPAIVIQEGFKIPDEGIRTIVFPAATHLVFPANIQATMMIAGIFDAEVHLYTVERQGQDWSEDLIKNIELARSEFEKNSIRYKRVSESQTTFSLGYSKQILKYAAAVSASMIAVMSIPTPEHYYFADADKEMLLTNDACIPILCTSGKHAI